MNKQEFLSALRSRLRGLPEADIVRSLDFYAEMIDDRMEDGLTEFQAVMEMGSIDEIAEQILLDTPLPKLVKAKMRPSRALSAWEIVLLVLGSPVWLPLLLTALTLLLTVYLLAWTVVVIFYAVDFAFAACSLGAIVGGIALCAAYHGAQVLCSFIGAGLVCAGLTILWFFVSGCVAMGIIWFTEWFGRTLKAQFIRKGEV